jgi:Ca2+-transporting ATPase
MAGGLSNEAARRLLAEHGANELPVEHGPGPLRILVEQFTGVMVWLLVAASALSAFLREIADAVAIAVIVLINAGIGFAQEYRAERAMDALRAMTAPRARVVRDGHAAMIPAREVVVGDSSCSTRAT